MRETLKLELLKGFKRHYDLQLFADGEPEEPEIEKGDNDEPDKAEPQAKYSDDDVDKIINKKFAEWEKKHKKEVDEAKKLAEMSATQKAEYERDQLKIKLDELEKKDSLSEMTKTARKILSDQGINISDDLLSVLVSQDAEETKESVDGFITLFNDAVAKAVKDALKGDAPAKKKATGTTKDQIMAIKNPLERQKMIAQNLELFK